MVAIKKFNFAKVHMVEPLSAGQKLMITVLIFHSSITKIACRTKKKSNEIFSLLDFKVFKNTYIRIIDLEW